MIAKGKAPARLLGAFTTAALAAGLGIAIAPSAMAVSNSVVLSSFDPGPIGVSGTVTISQAAPEDLLFVTVGFPANEYSTGFIGPCESNGVAASINGTPLAVVCGTSSSGAFNTLVVYNYWSSPRLSTGDVITVTWGETAATRTGVGAATSFGVATNSGPPTFTLVTPTLAGASAPESAAPESAAPDMTMWQQSIGRASADASCPNGYTSSWAEWPNSHHGGWVCNRELLAYSSIAGS
jgi:hypothetical protein